MFSAIPVSAFILLALLLGLTIGHVSGSVYPLIDNTATGFITLLQMTALPYISLSLMVSIGSLSPNKAGRYVSQAMLYVALLASITLAVIFLTPWAFPDWQNSDFYSATAIKAPETVNFVNLFIPANPFSAYAEGVIPSVVLFSVFIGIGLMKIRSKRTTITTLSQLQSAVANVSGIVMRFAPLGVFAIAWRASATIPTEQIEGLTVYIISALFVVFALVIVVLPLLTAALTPFSYGQIIKAYRSVLLTALATGSFFAMIPTIVEKSKELIEEYRSVAGEEKHIGEMLVPITFSLPVGGKLLVLLYLLFAAWFSGSQLSFSDQLQLIYQGIPQLFGTTTLAMTHLLDMLSLSTTMFDMFITAENLLVGRISSVLSVMFSGVLTILVYCGLTNTIKFDLKKTAKLSLIVPVVTFICLFGLHAGFGQMNLEYKGYAKFIERDFIRPQPQSSYLKEAPANAAIVQPFRGVLERVQKRGLLRVGYFRDDLPYAFHNKDGKLVGFDIEILNMLANDLSIDIEFVRIFHQEAAALLASGYLDITTGIPLIPDNMSKYTLSEPYSTQEIAFLIKDSRRKEFSQWDDITNREDLIIGIPETFFYKDAVNKYFNKGKAWEISTPRLFFKEEYQHIDALLFGAAAASGWTLLYPEYSVIAPKPRVEPIFMAFPINKNDHNFERFMRNWIAMKKQNGSLEKLFSYWIEGKTISP